MSSDQSGIDVHFAEPAEFADINMLFNRVFHENRTLEEFEWKFRNSPWTGALPAAVVGTIANRMVGVFGLLPHRFRWRSKELSAVQVLDVCVDQDVRQSGVNRAMLNFFLRHGAQFGQLAFGFPGQFYAGLGFDRLGYRLLTTMRAYGWNLRQFGDDHIDVFSADLAITDVDRLDDDWSQLLSTAIEDFGISTQRTMDYFRWRYREFPNRRYRFLTARRKSQVEGILVARQQSMETGVGIYELFATRADVVQMLLTHVLSVYGQLGAMQVTYWCSEYAPWQSELRRLGFERIESGPEYVVGLPLGEPDSQLERCFDSSAWFLTLGDTDL